MARRYQTRPSQAIGISDLVFALDFDLALTAYWAQQEAAEVSDALRQSFEMAQFVALMQRR